MGPVLALRYLGLWKDERRFGLVWLDGFDELLLQRDPFWLPVASKTREEQSYQPVFQAGTLKGERCLEGIV